MRLKIPRSGFDDEIPAHPELVPNREVRPYGESIASTTYGPLGHPILPRTQR